MYKCSAPGSLVLMGEHAVLQGGTAVLAALDERVEGTLVPRQDDRIVLRTNCVGDYTTTLEALKLVPPFHFVLAACQVWRAQLTTGFTVTLTTTFSTQEGLGSSAAVTVVMHGLLHAWCVAKEYQPEQLFKRALQSMRQAQHHVGSGADVAASLWGGLITYRQGHIPTKLPFTVPLATAYVGYKVATPVVLQQVAARIDRLAEAMVALWSAWEHCIQRALQALAQQDWLLVQELWTLHHGLQVAIGTSNADLEALRARVLAVEGIWAAKISGAGLGDSIVALGTPSTVPAFLVPRTIALQGLEIDA